jgi:hypothetical protein
MVAVAERLTVDIADSTADGETDATITGTAAQLYLALWNRGDEVAAIGRPDLLDRWRTAQRVTWG